MRSVLLVRRPLPPPPPPSPLDFGLGRLRLLFVVGDGGS